MQSRGALDLNQAAVSGASWLSVLSKPSLTQINAAWPSGPNFARCEPSLISQNPGDRMGAFFVASLMPAMAAISARPSAQAASAYQGWSAASSRHRTSGGANR